MVWYNPRTWFGNKGSLEGYLACNNPQCKKQIKNQEVAYNKMYNEFYHDGDCASLAIAHRTFNTGEMQFMEIEYVSREKAIKIKSGLESKLEPTEKQN